MSTAAEIIARVRSWSTSQDTTVLSNTEILKIMNDVAREAVDENDIWFCFGSGTTPLVYGGWTADLPDRLARPVTVFAGSGLSRSYYTHLTYEEFKILYLGESDVTTEDYYDTGPHYTLFGTEMWFGPPSSAALSLPGDPPQPAPSITITVEGLYYEPDLNLTSSTTNEFTDRAESFLLFATLERLTKFKFEEETRLGLFEQEKKKALNRIRAVGDLQENLARRAKSRRKG